LDGECFRKFLAKFKREVKKPDINAIIRRMSEYYDGKIRF